jgi:hypothetical protein
MAGEVKYLVRCEDMLAQTTPRNFEPLGISTLRTLNPKRYVAIGNCEE